MVRFATKIVMVTILVHPETESINKGGQYMAVHHGGIVGRAGKTLASKGSSKTAKTNAGKTLANHKASKHSK